MDLLIAESQVRSEFYKRTIPNPYDISTVWNIVSTWKPRLYIHGWYYLSGSDFGSHCVYGFHRIYYVDLFGYTYDSGPECVGV